jgi:hypothetical protein
MDDGATGLALSNFFLRLMVWLCVKDDNYPISHTCRTTGPKQDIAIKHIGMERLFEDKGRATEDKWPKIYLVNNTRNVPYHWHYCHGTLWLYITIEMKVYR